MNRVTLWEVADLCEFIKIILTELVETEDDQDCMEEERNSKLSLLIIPG